MKDIPLEEFQTKRRMIKNTFEKAGDANTLTGIRDILYGGLSDATVSKPFNQVGFTAHGDRAASHAIRLLEDLHYLMSENYQGTGEEAFSLMKLSIKWAASWIDELFEDVLRNKHS